MNKYLRFQVLEGYLIALLLVGAATGLRLALGWSLGFKAPFGTFYPAVILAAFIGGLGPALLANALSVLAAVLLFLNPVSMGGVKFPGELITIIMFLGSGILVAVMAQHSASVRTRKAREESEARFSAFMDNSPAIAWMKNEEGQYVYVSKAFERAFADRHDEWRGKTDFDLWPHEAAEQLRKNDLEVLSGGKPAEYVETTGTVGGLRRYWLNSKFPIRDAAGNRYVAGIGVDISRLKQAEEALRESEGKYRALFNSIDEGFCIIEVLFDENRAVDYRFLDTNPAFEKQSGLVHAQGRRIRELVPEHDEHWFEVFGGVALTGGSVRFQDRAEQLQRWYDVFAFRLGEPREHRVAVLFNDITERKQTEVASRRHWELLQAIMDQLPLAVNIVQGEDLVIQYVNPAYIAFAPGKEMAGKSMREVWPEAKGRWEETFLHVLLTGENYTEADQPYEVGRYPGGSLETRYFTWSLSRIRLPDGSWGLLNIAWETTDRRQMEDELKNARDELERRVEARTEELQNAYYQIVSETRQRRQVEEQLLQSQKMEAIGTLAGGIAHDLNNMLAVIIGNAELALDELEANGNRGEHEIEQVLKASKRARDLVKQILTFSRRSDRQRKPLRLGPIIKETAKLLRGSLPSTIRIEVDIRAYSDTVLADPSQIQQILVNLASNAAFAMREEGGRLTVILAETVLDGEDKRPDPGLQPGRYLKLEVSDTGSGMSPEIRKRIFDPFFTTKKPGEGTGMGLAVVFGIVQTLNGAITVESGMGEGSTFTVYLPGSEETAEEEQHETGPLPKGGEHVLVVDDEPLVLEVVSDMLRRLGYRVTNAGSGAEGLRLFEADSGAFDLVITDHVMPEITGLRLAEKILEIRKDIPIILFTGYSETVSPERAKAAGITEFLMKPIVRTELAEAVRRILEGLNRPQ